MELQSLRREGKREVVRTADASVRQMHIQNLYMPVNEIVPEFNGEPAEHMHLNAATGCITFDEIGETGRERSDLSKRQKFFDIARAVGR